MAPTFLFPTGFLVIGILVLILLILYVKNERFQRRVLQAFAWKISSHIGLKDFCAFVVLGILLATAAARPVISFQELDMVRNDAVILMVFDVSGSMAASMSQDMPSRLDRAKKMAHSIGREFRHIPIGIAGFTDVLIPHLPPIAEGRIVHWTIENTIRIGSVPTHQMGGIITSLYVLQYAALARFFPENIEKKIILLFTDGETHTSVFTLREVGEALRKENITLMIVGMGKQGERIFIREESMGTPRVYIDSHIPKTDLELLRTFAFLTSGAFVSEDEFDTLVPRIRRELGTGSQEITGSHTVLVDVSTYILAFALAPLTFLIVRRAL